MKPYKMFYFAINFCSTFFIQFVGTILTFWISLFLAKFSILFIDFTVLKSNCFYLYYYSKVFHFKYYFAFSFLLIQNQTSFYSLN